MITRKRMPMEELSELLLLQMKNGGRAHLTVTGVSMLPLFQPHRDAVELIAPEGKHKKGDIILYRRENGQYVLHRIIACKKEGYLCSGDNQLMRERVMPGQVLAVADGYIRKEKHHTVRDFGYRLYKFLWVGAFPLRGGYVVCRRLLGKIRRTWNKHKKT